MPPAPWATSASKAAPLPPGLAAKAASASTLVDIIPTPGPAPTRSPAAPVPAPLGDEDTARGFVESILDAEPEFAQAESIMEEEVDIMPSPSGATLPSLSVPDEQALPLPSAPAGHEATVPSFEEMEASSNPGLSESLEGETFGTLATSEVPHRRLRAARWPTFPRDLLRIYGGGIGRFIMGRPFSQRIALIAAPIVILGGLLIVIVAFSGGGPRSAYLTERQALWGGPGEAGTYPSNAQLERGEHVMVYDRVGDYALVRDDMGRSGYVVDAQLVDDPPAVNPGQPLAGCWQSPLEESPERCQARAQRQFSSCRMSCGDGAGTEGAACLDHCQERFTACLQGCDGAPDVAAAPVPEPTPILGDGQAQAVAPAPEDRGEVTPPPPATKKKALKKAAKKTTKKKKRRAKR